MATAKKLIDTLKEEIKPFRRKASASYMQLVELLPLQTISTHEQHALALKLVERLIAFSTTEKSKDEGVQVYLQTLSELVGEYEKQRFKTATTSGREMLAYLMELQGLNQKDLSKEVGGQSVVSKILSGEREMNLRQIKALSKRFRVSPGVFI